MPATPELALSVQTGEGGPPCPVPRARLRRWVLRALERDARVVVRFVGTREGRALNREYRGRDYATNVLTFAYDAPPGGAASRARGPIAADIVICLPVLERESRRQRKPLDHHLAHLVIHGVLHAQGWEHEDDAQAAAMESRETALLRGLRIPDPYAPARRGFGPPREFGYPEATRTNR